MKYYCVAELDIIDQSWVAEYVENVTKLVERYGGKYLARTSNVERLEGEGRLPQVFLIVEWPSKDAALSFYNSEEYRPYLKARTGGARNELVLVAGEDMTRLARIDD
ncbi:MAG TPA: DUF1330 domain-containing protein [Pyrinomonadaceae bacterium]|nr:DUF1330 domain-containing protein [Pyrinomonadaceae bacterium]